MKLSTIKLIESGFAILGLSILLVEGSNNLDEYTGQILVRLTLPILALGTVLITRDAINHSDI